MSGASVGAAGGRRATTWTRYVLRPVLILGIVVGVFVWINMVELDSIEQRLLSTDVIVEAVIRHIQLVVISTVTVVALAVPAGIALTRRNRLSRTLGPPILAIANAGQAVPSLGILVLIAVFTQELGFWPTIIALVLYAFLPILRNTMVGLEQVDESVIESAVGMGMTKRGVLRRIELPLAVPVVLAGVRTALVINVGTATVATLVNSGGLGDIVYGGIVQSRSTVLWAGALLVAALALAIDFLGGLAEDQLRPKGI